MRDQNEYELEKGMGAFFLEEPLPHGKSTKRPLYSISRTCSDIRLTKIRNNRARVEFRYAKKLVLINTIARIAAFSTPAPR